MSVPRKIHLLYILVAVILLSSCDKKGNDVKTVDTAAASIIAVNYPLYYFTQQLAADLATVILPVPAGIDPAQWNPQLADILQMQQAELIILNGAGYSTWLDKVSLSPNRLVNSSLDAKDQWITLSGQTTHSHGPVGEHSHSGYAFTTWMDMTLAKQQASAIARALIKRWPGQQQAIALREARLLEALTELDKAYQQLARDLTGNLAGKNLIYSHPVYQYFERRYQLAGESLHWEPGEMPSEKQWQELGYLVAGKSNSLFIWEDEPSAGIAERMAGMANLGLAFVVIRPAANTSSKDWLGEQQDNIKRLRELTF
jgi:zinc transport system substrate-binding protein